eukprot:GHVT01076791.1.p2 GENE.GHVT01076791.1~~GHVT01076791.1.p2  ORF type:complete len:266 (+),score=27.27 GHVT01076791.1:1681-2478(+)
MREKLRACHLPPRLSSLASGMRPGVGGASVDSSTRRSCTLERIRSDPSSSSPSASSSSSFEKLNAFAELCSLLELDHGAFRDAGSFDVTIDSKVGAAGTGNINTAPVALGSSLQQSSNGLPPPLRSSSIGGLTGCPEGTEAEDGPCRFPGLAEAISRCVEAAGTRGAVPVRMELLTSALVVGGGCTLFPNFFGRLQQEISGHAGLASLSPSCLPIVGSPRDSERLHATWIGGSILGCLGSFRNFAITRADVEEEGIQNALYRKCP